MTVRVVRDIFNEDFSKVIVSGDEAWQTIHEYVAHVAPDLADRLSRWTSEVDVFATFRIDEQLLKALDRKVWLPSGGSLVIDKTEAMVVVDVNTGKFTGQGGNLEETVTRNNLEAAEEIVRQLRLRDLGGIVVVDFIDMVLESNRDLVMRRLLECLGRDRTKHQVAEVTSLGLVQMTRKRVGTGLLEAFSTTCEHCRGRGVVVTTEPMTHNHGNGGGNGSNGNGQQQQAQSDNKQDNKPAEKPGRKRNRNRHRGDEQPAAEVAPAEVVEAAPAEADAAASTAPDGEALVAPAEPVATAEPAAAEEAAPAVAAASVTGQAAVSVPYEVPEQPTAAAANGHHAAAEPVAEPAPVASATRRRVRRAASRPAGPPASTVTQD
jgi:ribonuclease E